MCVCPFSPLYIHAVVMAQIVCVCVLQGDVRNEREADDLSKLNDGGQGHVKASCTLVCFPL